MGEYQEDAFQGVLIANSYGGEGARIAYEGVKMLPRAVKEDSRRALDCFKSLF